MNGFESKLAVKAVGEIAKPLGSIFDALLGHKIEGLKKWAIDKDLEKYAADENISSLLKLYVERTLKKVSRLSTIVFPQERIELKKVYENIVAYELSSSGDGVKSNIKRNHEFDFTISGMTYFITDVAGMGKSTFVKNMCLEIFDRSEKVPIFFELSEFDQSLSLIDNLAKNFDDLDKVFNRDLFKKLVAKGKFFVILDGFDEVAVDSRKILISQIEVFDRKKQKNSLVLTSRPQEAVPVFDNAVRLGLKSLSRDQVISILNKYDNFSDLDIGFRLQKEFERIPEKFLTTLLLVGLLYRTYGFNNSIAQKISIFYSEIFDALYKGHDLTKSGYVREKLSGLDVDEFRRLFRPFCFFYIFKNSDQRQSANYFVSLVADAKKVCSIKEFLPQNFIDDLLVAVPLLARDGLSIKFMHRSIAEYFAAEYIAYCSKAGKILEKINDEEFSGKFREAIEYIYDISPGLYRKYVTAPIARRFLEFSEGDHRDALFDTMSFFGKWCMSLHICSEVRKIQKNGRKEIDIPRVKDWKRVMSQYTYGSVNGIEYVCAISAEMNFPINTNAWIELSAPIVVDDIMSMSAAFVQESVFSELVSNFEMGKWHQWDSMEVYQFRSASSLRWLLSNFLSRKNDFKVSTVDLNNSEISREKCLNLINLVDGLTEAEEGLAGMLGLE
ncbi:NACHT domain-containing NTPase [Janthinobacterium sp. PAMC25594]|uniref:NACHT domain-containing protein n=1 Tax=Janthinobacterium sp. PAMC25594 TaxID=2861284 RepID=UPI001C630BF6|nr:NACHT domain-containing protein [Janthinobacterium sp. PAMC25594]QYG06071.1 NACHT domain-containing protein [Janthinobacterium sp. PAMC25594]